MIEPNTPAVALWRDIVGWGLFLVALVVPWWVGAVWLVAYIVGLFHG